MTGVQTCALPILCACVFTSPGVSTIFLLSLILSKFIFYSLLLYCFFSFLFFSFFCRATQLAGSWCPGRAQAPVVGALSPNCWTNREPQTPGNINQSEASRRSSSRHQDLALPNCLQTPGLDASGQTTSKTGTQPHPSKKKMQ